MFVMLIHYKTASIMHRTPISMAHINQTIALWDLSKFTV